MTIGAAIKRSGRRDLLLLTAGRAVSAAGDTAALVALLLRLRPEGSGWVAGLLAAELVPFIVCAPLSGRVVDRIETRRVLLVALIGQGVVAIPLALVSGPWATVALFAALNTLSTLVRPATSTLVPVIAGPDAAALGYSRLAVGSGIGYIVGPALGGLISGSVGVSTTLLVDAATFGVLSLATALIRARRPPARARSETRQDRAWDGFALMWRSPVLRVALLVSAVATGCAVVDNVAAPFRFINQLGTDDFGYGLYLTVWGVGSLLGVQLPRRVPDRHHPTLLAAANLLVGAGIAGIGLAPDYALALVASAVGGFGNGLENVTNSALVARLTPDAQHGQAFAAVGATVQTAIGIGTAAAAPLVDALGAGRAMGVAGGLAVAISLGGLTRAGASSRVRGDLDNAAP